MMVSSRWWSSVVMMVLFTLVYHHDGKESTPRALGTYTQVEQIEARLRAGGANDGLALLLARDGRAHQALSLWRDSAAPRRTHDSEVRR